MTRTVYYISDGTGISAETLGHSLMTQFEQIEFQSTTLPYIDTEEKAKQAIVEINKSFNEEKERPIVFSTIVKPEIRNIIAASAGFVIDFFQTFIGPLEKELKMPSAHLVGLSHALANDEQYNSRIEAVHFALQCDDGMNTAAYVEADIILVGISRSGKTPTCLYLALQYGIRAANYPLTEEDLKLPYLPKALTNFQDKLFGLTITAERLHQIRNKRRSNSVYASFEQCEFEVQAAESLFHKEKLDFLDSTHLSIEELAAHILDITHLRHKTYHKTTI